MTTREEVVTDCESNRTFCLIIENGKLTRLNELVRSPLRWAEVDTMTDDGAEWWEQWESEVNSGNL